MQKSLWEKYWIIFLLPFMVIFMIWQSSAGSYDDAFITYRYSANLINGNGLVYNLDEWILGTTAPGYAILLALLSFPFGATSIPDVALVINGVAFVITLILIMLMVLQVTGNRVLATLAMIICISSTQGVDIIASGMETSVYVLLIVAGFYYLLKDRYLIGALLIGLLPFIRPEGVFAIGTYGLTMMYIVWNSGEKNAVKWFIRMIPYGVLLLLPSLIYVLLLSITYGSPLPLSITAKSSNIYSLTTAQSSYGMILLLGDIATGYFEILGIELPLRIRVISAFFTIVLALFGAYKLIKYDYRLWGIPLIVTLHILLYAFSGSIIFAWYVANFGIFYLLLVWAGFYYGVVIVTQRLGENETRRKAIYALSVGIVMVSITTQLPYLLKPKIGYYPSAQYYQPLAEQIREKLPEQTTIALHEIGILGFYLPDIYVLDAAGLISPKALKYYPVPNEQRVGTGHGVIPREFIQDELPDILISLEYFGRFTVFNDPWFLDNYTLVIDVPVDSSITGTSKGFWIYSRNDFEPGLTLAH